MDLFHGLPVSKMVCRKRVLGLNFRTNSHRFPTFNSLAFATRKLRLLSGGERSGGGKRGRRNKQTKLFHQVFLKLKNPVRFLVLRVRSRRRRHSFHFWGVSHAINPTQKEKEKNKEFGATYIPSKRYRANQPFPCP